MLRPACSSKLYVSNGELKSGSVSVDGLSGGNGKFEIIKSGQHDQGQPGYQQRVGLGEQHAQHHAQQDQGAVQVSSWRGHVPCLPPWGWTGNLVEVDSGGWTRTISSGRAGLT